LDEILHHFKDHITSSAMVSYIPNDGRDGRFPYLDNFSAASLDRIDKSPFVVRWEEVSGNLPNQDFHFVKMGHFPDQTTF